MEGRDDENPAYWQEPIGWGSSEEEMFAEAFQVAGDRLSEPEAMDESSSDEVLPDAPRELERALAAAGPALAPPAVLANNFLIRGKKLYLTFPQCDTPPDVVLANILSMRGPDKVKWAVVGKEKHLDGHDHLHCAIWLKFEYYSTRPHCLDELAGKHGNYQKMRNPVKCVEYCIKDGEFVASPGFNPEAYVAGRKKKTSTSFEHVAALVSVEGKTLAQINVMHPGFVLQHLTKLRAYSCFVQANASAGELAPWPPIPTPTQEAAFFPAEHAVLAWLIPNLMVGDVRLFKQPQLMIIGPTGVGKTSLIMSLCKHCRVYWLPMGEDFYDGYSDEAYDLIVVDEFRSQKTIQFLNSFVQGSPVSLRIKGAQITKRKNLPVIVLSNYEPAQSYHKVQQSNPGVLQAFMSRFQVVRCLQDDRFYSLCDYFGGANAPEPEAPASPQSGSH